MPTTGKRPLLARLAAAAVALAPLAAVLWSRLRARAAAKDSGAAKKAGPRKKAAPRKRGRS